VKIGFSTEEKDAGAEIVETAGADGIGFEHRISGSSLPSSASGAMRLYLLLVIRGGIS
jgi:hypothetical protein